MGIALMSHYKFKEKWQIFEEEFKIYERNMKTYKGIHPKVDTYSWVYKFKGKQVKNLKSLTDIYAFKLEFESENK